MEGSLKRDMFRFGEGFLKSSMFRFREGSLKSGMFDVPLLHICQNITLSVFYQFYYPGLEAKNTIMGSSNSWNFVVYFNERLEAITEFHLLVSSKRNALGCHRRPLMAFCIAMA
jgi:hypothetical protein